MAPVSNRFAKYIIQPDTAGGGSAPAPKANRFAKYKAGEAPAVQQANPMVAQGQAAQREYEAAGAPAIPKDNSIRPAPAPAQLRPDVDLRNVNRAPQTMGPGYAETPGSEIVGSDLQKGIRTIPQHVGNAAIGAAGSPELPADNTVRMPAARDPLAPRAGEEWRKIDRSAQPAPQSPFRSKEHAERIMAATAETNKAKRDNEEYRAERGPVINAISDFLIGGLNAGDQALYSAADAGLNAIDPERRGAKAVRESLLPFAGLRENNDIVRAIPEMAAGIAENPASGAATVVEGTEPTHMIARGGNNLRDAGRAALQGDFKEAQAQYSEATPDLLLGTLGVTPFGSMAVSAAERGVAAPGEALRAQMGRAAEGFRQLQGRSDAAIGAAKQQAETRAQLQAALDAANARGDREAAAQLESQLRDSTFIIDPQTGQRAGAATRAAQPQPIPTATQTAAGAPPIQPPPPAVASANAAVPTPGVVPPAGNLVPIPQNEAVAAFNALPPKTREAMLRTLNSAGMDANGFWSDTWRKLTGRFRNSSEAMDAIRKLGDMPEDQQVMFALELIKNNGGDLETILPAMGRKWATEGARDPQLFGGTDRAREIMDANVPKVINSQGERVAGIAEDKFGPGIVPAGEAIDVEKRVLAKQYDTLLNPQRKQYGRLRNPQKLASIDKAWNDIKAYLKRPEVIDQMPDWVKLKVMQRASEDMRNIGFTDAEMSTILAGDGAVLAPLFEASGPLTWSPQMWTHLVDQYPTQAAHVLQSAYREAADGLMSGVSRTQADVTNAQYLMRLRGESGKGGLVDMLERAIPGKGGKIDGEGGYQWTRTNFGDNRSAERAFDILERFKTAANSEGDVAAIIKELKDLPARHREAAENQITSLIRQELGRKVDNVKLSELDNPDRLSAPNLTALSNQNFLNALEDVFGPRGKELADGIRLARASTDTLTSISPKYNSRTQLNAEDVKNAGARYEDPAGAEGGVIDKTVGGLASGGLATGGAAALGISAAGGLTVPLLGLAAGKALYNAYKAGKRLSNTERNQLVDFLFRARKAGEGDPLPRKINHGNVLRSAAVNAAVGGTIGGLSSEGDPNAIAAGIVGGAGFGAARKIIRSRSSLIKPPGPVGPRLGPRGPATPVNALRGPGGSTPPSSPANALSTPPRPPVKAGFGGSSKPLPMDEASRMGRAREQGFDTGRVAYRGLGRAYDESGKGGGRRYQMFTSSESDAAEYGSNVVSAYLRKGNNLQLDGGGRNFNSVSVSQLPDDVRAKLHPSIQGVARIDDIADAAQKAGYDSVTVANVFDNAWGEVPTKQRPRTQKDIDLDNDLLRELGIDPADTPSAPRAPSPPKKNTDPVTIDVVFDTKNIRSADATFDPSQSGSSKLLAGMGAAPEGVGATAGATAGYALNPTDANGDGVIDDKDRGLNAMAGLISGGLGVKGARMGAGAFGNALKRSSAPRALETSGSPKIVRPELKLTERVDTPKPASATATPGKTAVSLNRPITITSGKSDTGKGYTVTAEAYNDRGRMVLSPEWPTNAFDELDAAKLKRAEELLYPQAPKPTLVDENYGKPPAPKPAWEVENPKASAEIDKKVADRFVGLMNADPSPAHVLALREGVGLQTIGDIIERGLPKGKQIWIAKDGGEIAVVDKAWHRQNPQEYPIELWSRMWPGSVTREGRRYGWKDGRPTIFAGDAAKPTQAGFLPSGSGKPGAKPPANALAGPPKPKPVEARREAPRGTKSFSDPRLSPGENKTAEMVLNGYTYDEIADEAMTSVDVIKRQAMLAQRKLGDDVKLPRPGMGKRPPGSTKRDAANSLFGEGLDNATIAQRTGLSIGNVRTYRSYWKEQSNAPVASVEGAAYNPPAMPERPFEADYPQQDWPDGPPVDAQGRLTRDRDGRPLDQTSVIIGRNKAPGYGPKSEADRSLRDRIAVIQTLKKAGSSLKRVPRSPDQTSGAWLPKFNDKDRYTGRGVAQITDDLDRPIAGLDDQEVITLSHELAHSIDFKTRPASDTSAFNNRKWGIDHKNPYMTPEVKAELESQLQRIYQDLNNPIDGEVKIRTPKDHGYESIDADRELWAEAIRAYMYDPNYIKTVAPDVAFMIRDNVNKNGSLRKTIQFNAIPTIVGVGGLGLGAAALNGQPAEAKTRSSGMRANALAPAQNNRP